MTTLNGQIIGQAERATRAVFDRFLATDGTDFTQWVVLNLLAADGGDADEAAHLQRVAAGLKVDIATVRLALDQLVEAGLVTRQASRLSLTAAGERTRARVQAGVDTISARLYGDLPADDLQTAGSVLTIVTERANAALAN